MKKPKTKGKLFTHPKKKSSSSSSKLEKIGTSEPDKEG